MELAPTSEGIVATFFTNGAESSRKKVNVAKDDPAALAQRWLGDRKPSVCDWLVRSNPRGAKRV